jgi:hypothetical protein
VLGLLINCILKNNFFACLRYVFVNLNIGLKSNFSLTKTLRLTKKFKVDQFVRAKSRTLLRKFSLRVNYFGKHFGLRERFHVTEFSTSLEQTVSFVICNLVICNFFLQASRRIFSCHILVNVFQQRVLFFFFLYLQFQAVIFFFNLGNFFLTDSVLSLLFKSS